jgi:hypothetical protein
VCAAIAVAAACVNPASRAARNAAAAGFGAIQLQGRPFSHTAFFRDSGSGGPLWVFIDGDGSPWIRGGTEIATDPTPRRPLALSLALATPGAVLYLGRPCYFAARRDPACNAELWTRARYGEAVVDSLATAVNGFAAAHGQARVVLVGYSGGGALAALLAPRLPPTTALVTIAANLDTDRWALLHGYTALTGSLNPALLPPPPPDIVQIHLVGDADRNVPPAAMSGYFQRAAAATVWHYAAFDHSCCWEREWPQILIRLQSALPP